MNATIPYVQPPSEPDVPVAGLRVLGTRRVIWFRDLFCGQPCIHVGRSRHRDIRIRDDLVSRRHCVIEQKSKSKSFWLIPCDSTNGVFVSPGGRYTGFREVDDRAEIKLGMLIQFGPVTVAPITESGACPTLVTRLSEFIRFARPIHGSQAALARFTGIPIALARKVLEDVTSPFRERTAR